MAAAWPATMLIVLACSGVIDDGQSVLADSD